MKHKVNLGHIIGFIVLLLCGGCTAEGNSRGIFGVGESVRFLTMGYCEDEAFSEHDGGGNKYDSYECHQMVLGIFQAGSKSYSRVTIRNAKNATAEYGYSESTVKYYKKTKNGILYIVSEDEAM